MPLSWFHESETWAVVLVLMMGMMGAAEIGYLFGRRHSAAVSASYFIAVQGSLLGLQGLLLGFTFSLSVQRHELRQQLVMDDATVLNTLWLRAGLLPEPQRGEFETPLRQYVGLRAEVATLGREPTAAELSAGLDLAETLHRRMWEVVRAGRQDGPAAEDADTLVTLLSDAMASHRRRVQAYEARVPGVTMALLLVASLTSMAAVGYSGGLNKIRGMLPRIMIVLLVCGTIYTILDLDTPGRGLIQVDQSPILRVHQMIEQDAETRQVIPGPVGPGSP
ncbi:MAG: hypothetical protein KBE04_14120 [Phycisphaerae bacterium]|nr:hypothetical protein [Phycisphaerae bacterium]